MNEETKKSPRSKEEDNIRELKIEVSKYKSILEVLGDKDKTWRVVFTVFFLGVFLFAGIAVVASAIKKLYPYSDITTNGLGATTIKNEKKEVSYWLYNTSELWANSGINVNAGDILTIRSSGKFYTAIHHLYDSALKNTIMKDKWVGSEGEIDTPNNLSEGSYYRRKFRMFPNLPTGTLVMQVVNKQPYDSSRDSLDRYPADPDNFYFVGKERQNIYIKNPGTLYFSLNDIVLNNRTIVELLFDCLSDSEIYVGKTGLSRIKNKLINFNLSKVVNDTLKIKDMFNDFATIFKKEMLGIEPGGRAMGKYKLGVTKLSCKDLKKTFPKLLITNGEDICIDTEEAKKIFGSVVWKGEAPVKEVVVCEMEYYWKNGYKTAWFDDNIGSFLIIVEKNK